MVWFSRFVVVSLAIAAAGAYGHAQVELSLLSSDSAGGPSDNESKLSSISADGRFVAFDSHADDLVPGDQGGHGDVFVLDRLLGTLEIATVSSSGAQADWDSGDPDLSADGRYVAFLTGATNLTPLHGFDRDLVVKDRLTGAIALASVSTSGVPSDGINWEPTLSGDGRYLVFSSNASNLVPGDDGLYVDVFVRDLVNGTTVRASVDSSGLAGNGNSISARVSFDGRWIVFASYASNLVPGDTNGGGIGATPTGIDVFLHDLQTGATERMSVKSNGQQAASGSHDPSISADGRFVCFASRAPDLVPGDTNKSEDMFVHDRLTGAVERVSVGPGGSQGDGHSNKGTISADGNSVVFVSAASNLVPNDTNLHRDVFVRDRAAKTTTFLTVDPSGLLFEQGGYDPAISADGRLVTFQSGANNVLVASNGYFHDVFLADRGSFVPQVYCTAKVNSLGCTPSIGATGVARATSGTVFLVYAFGLIAARPVQMCYGVSGPNTTPFHNGTLCVRPPLRRLPLQFASGSIGCRGVAFDDFNQQIASGADPALVVGQHVWAQYWGRDDASLPGFAYTLTDAVEFSIEP